MSCAVALRVRICVMVVYGRRALHHVCAVRRSSVLAAIVRGTYIVRAVYMCVWGRGRQRRGGDISTAIVDTGALVLMLPTRRIILRRDAEKRYRFRGCRHDIGCIVSVEPYHALDVEVFSRSTCKFADKVG